MMWPVRTGAVIGSDGFGFAPKPDGSYEKIPQRGNVIIEDDVEIGVGTEIGAFSPALNAESSRGISTRLKAGTAQKIALNSFSSAVMVGLNKVYGNLMVDLQRRLQLTYLFISHNLAVVYHISTRVGVMYLGRLVEQAPTETLFTRPKHPYTRMLLDAIPDIHMSGRARNPVQGEVPNPLSPPAGCAFHPRCPHAAPP